MSLSILVVGSNNLLFGEIVSPKTQLFITFLKSEN